MKKELVSVIMPSYNSGAFIAEAIRSVLQQTYLNWELLITDDASDDNTVEIVQSFVEQDPRIRLFRIEMNSGVATARNNSISHAKGRFFAFLDSDDCWHPEKLEKQLAFMEQHQCAFSFTAYQLMNANGDISHRTISVPSEISHKQYLKNTIIGCLTVILDKEKIGEFAFPNLRIRQDMALWLTILRDKTNAYGLNEVLAYYRLNPNSISANKVNAAKTVWKVYRELEHLSLAKSIYNFIGYAFKAAKKRI